MYYYYNTYIKGDIIILMNWNFYLEMKINLRPFTSFSALLLSKRCIVRILLLILKLMVLESNNINFCSQWLSRIFQVANFDENITGCLPLLILVVRPNSFLVLVAHVLSLLPRLVQLVADLHNRVILLCHNVFHLVQPLQLSKETSEINENTESGQGILCLVNF